MFHVELLSQLHFSWLQVSGCPWSSGAWSDGDKNAHGWSLLQAAASSSSTCAACWGCDIAQLGGGLNGVNSENTASAAPLQPAKGTNHNS